MSYSDFTIDKTKGLNGHCDYILSKPKEQLMLTAPVVMLVEAKNDKIIEGIPNVLQK